MFVVDTNVLVYVADASCAEHARCRGLLEQWRRSPSAWYLTWGICYEFLRVVTHPRVLRRPWTLPEAVGFLDALQASPSLGLLVATDRHPAVLAEVTGEAKGIGGNLVHDLHTVVLMREHGIRRICTRDTDFHRFAGVEPIDPLSGDP